MVGSEADLNTYVVVSTSRYFCCGSKCLYGGSNAYVAFLDIFVVVLGIYFGVLRWLLILMWFLVLKCWL